MTYSYRHSLVARIHVSQVAYSLKFLSHRAAASPNLFQIVRSFQRDLARPNARRNHTHLPRRFSTILSLQGEDEKNSTKLRKENIQETVHLPRCHAKFSQTTTPPVAGPRGHGKTHFVQLTTPTPNSVCTSSSFSTRNISTPANTPNTPSYLPPLGCVSRCDPANVAGPGRRPGRTAKVFPIASILTLQPSCRVVSTNQSRARRSASERARRDIPMSFGPLLEGEGGVRCVCGGVRDWWDGMGWDR